MPDQPSHLEQGQAERARRLRNKIEELKSGVTPQPESQQPKSLKEQIEERAAEQEKKS
jgi:hypothetical protein